MVWASATEADEARSKPSTVAVARNDPGTTRSHAHMVSATFHRFRDISIMVARILVTIIPPTGHTVFWIPAFRKPGSDSEWYIPGQGPLACHVRV